MKTRNARLLIALILSIIGTARVALAYDQPTHALITYEAYQKSVLNPSDPHSIVHILMFDRLDPTVPFLFGYADNQATNDDPSLYTRSGQEEERAVFRLLIDAGRITNASSVNGLEYRADGWLMDGAIREDDFDFKDPVFGDWWKTDQRDDDPWGNLFRSSNHFYDPIHDRAFDYPAPCADYGCTPSPQWALGTMHPLSPPGDSIDTSRRNHFTWEDARLHYWDALTKERYPNGGTFADREDSFFERYEHWATAIKSLGHVVHLLEDGAQPQHVRNDAHSPPPANYFYGGLNYETSGAYEDFTDYRVTGQNPTGLPGGLLSPLRYMDESLPPTNQIPALVFDGYPIPSFATPAEFFTTRYYDNGTDPAGINARRGMIDFANRNFFTAGTPPGFEECVNPGIGSFPCTTRDSSPTYPLPENDLTNAVYAQLPPVTVFRVNGFLVAPTLFARQTVDPLDPGFDSTVLPASFNGKTPIAAKGALYDQGFPVGVSTASTYANFIYDANVLLPRAVSYSAGLINYFFRGTIDVETSTSGVLAVLNQGAAHSVNQFGYPCVGSTPSDGCAIFGFTQLRLKLHNTTPSITESGGSTAIPQAMIATTAGTPNFSNPNSGNAYLVAVARYHLDACYTPSLAGLPVQTFAGTITQPATTCAAGSIRTPDQEISVSQSIAIPAATLNGSTATEEVFDFSADPIPVNATDLFVQVVYRGPLGQEADGIAVGTLDIPEPSFFAFWNNTDYFVNSGDNWIADTSSPFIRQAVQSLTVCGASKELYTFSGTPGNEISYPSPDNPGAVRLAILLDSPFPTHRVFMQARSVAANTPSGNQPPDYSDGFIADVRQANIENLPDADLATPVGTCATTDPTQPACWRFDPVAKRRSFVWGSNFAWWPLHIQDVNAQNTPDVDSVTMTAFTTATFIQGGTVNFNNATLTACPF